MLGLELDAIKNSSIWVVAGAIVLALIAVWVVKAVVTKILTVVILLAVAGLVWSQRAELTDCADRVKATVDQGFTPDTTCRFFGRDVTIPGRDSIVDGLNPLNDPATTTTPVG